MKQVAGYQLLRELPRGRAGRRFVASNPRPSRREEENVALTLIDPEWVQDAAYLTILNAEAEAAVAFRHHASAAVIEVNRIENNLAQVVELIDGQPLAEFLERTRRHATRLSWHFFVWMGVEIARLLQVAHATPWAEGEVKGMFHGQLCPKDVYITYDGRVKVNGIGLGRSRARLPFNAARTPYRAPESFERHKADHLTDIYGLGLVLHDAICGRTTFARDTEAATRRAVVAGEVPPLHLDAPTLAPAVGSLIGRMLAKLPSERPASLFEIETTLKQHLDQPEDYYVRGFAEHMRALFKTTASASPLPPVILPEPPPISAPADDTWATDPGLRADEGFVDPLDIEELAEAIVAHPGNGVHVGVAAGAAMHAGGGEAAFPHTPPPMRSPFPPPAPYTPPPHLPEPRRMNGDLTPPALLEGLDRGSSSDLDAIVEAIVRGGSQTGEPQRDPFADPTPTPSYPVGASPPPPRPPRRPTRRGEDDGADSGFEIERNETPFPVFRGEAPRGISLEADDVVIEDVEEPASYRPSSSSPEMPRAISAPDAPWSGSTPSSPWSSSTPGRRSYSGSDPNGTSPFDEVTGPLLAPGDVLAGRYRVLEVLGEGGVSVVYRAEHMALMKQVALKVMRPELSSMQTAQERFLLEARSVSQLDHPNIVRVTDFSPAEDGRMFLVMELIEGEPLSSVMDRAGSIDARTALTFGVQLLRGLRHAHERGVVHRDLKPDNIIITRREGEIVAKILDFGIAKLTDRQQGARSITQAGTVFGTPRYMSPEQAAGEAVDHRADIYAVGVILYQLLTGRLPFDGGSTVQILSRVLTQPPPPMQLGSPNRAAGRDIEDLVMRALEKEREDRYESATDFLMAIEAVARKHRLFG